MLYYCKIIKNIRIIIKAYINSDWLNSKAKHPYYIWNILPTIVFYKCMSYGFVFKEQPCICLEFSFLIWKATISFCKIADPFELILAREC